MIFLPIGNPADSFYGADRKGTNLYANCVVALDANSGKLRWYYQMVHHDLFDYDISAPPALIELKREGRTIPAVAQITKMGLLFVFDRVTGEPVYGMEERPVPQTAVPGEVTSKTQPFPVKPPPLAPQTLSADQAWGPTPEDRESCRNYIQHVRNEGIFTPPSLQGTLMVPGNIGGMTWSGYAFDPKRNILVANINNLVAVARLIPREKYNDRGSHTEDGDYGDQTGAPYGLYRRFLQSPSDLPCSAPPWGMLTAVDMTEGKIRWQVPLGSMQNFGGSHSQQIPPGSISLGGPIVTAGGLAFISGTTDCILRGFDIETGKELWKASLPACGNATPMTYRLSSTGKQYLVIAAGGHPKITEEKLGDSLVAFTLP